MASLKLRCALLVAFLQSGCVGTVAQKYWRAAGGHIVVAGPMLGPFDNLSALAPRLCDAIRVMPGATVGNRREGQEYCGLVYQRNFEAAFFASYPSSISSPVQLPGGRKSCSVPSAVSDPDAYNISIYADFHSHPSVTPFSNEDLQAQRQRYYFRVMFNPLCEVYLYDFQERTVYRLMDGEFHPTKRVTDDIRGE
ncbi:hypothetical protein JKA73_02215 [Myxococcus xanthus]|uniref:hypothetical protein n=1 Tax=Myxococcus xanthus TaxID=34 RepID=UPI0019176494|nr:hypothetical protein [Myxococcus xanthus]QQR44983.1 hypothetical protein JKA73_02215 [Myxococcus xanthus]